MKCVIVTGGDAPRKIDLQKQISDAPLVIAVDGAADLFDRWGLVPHYIIGDMDTAASGSLSRLADAGAVAVTLQREKNETDSEAAMNFALKSGADDIVILGATGGRFDHTMGNIAMLVRAARASARCRIIDKMNEMWAATGEHDVFGRIGQTVSIVALTGDLIVTAANLKYPLQNLKLGVDASRGISNIIVDSPAHLSISGGYALIVKINS
jgi:thiamine pyrophosphokinase